jgi:hypothetical protein
LLAGPLADLKTRLGAAFGRGVLAAAAVVTAAISFLLFGAALFLWLAREYDAIVASLVTGVLFLLLATIKVLIWLALGRRHRARVREEDNRWWQEPAVLLAGLEAVRIVGARRLLPIAALAGVIAGLTSTRPAGANRTRRKRAPTPSPPDQ